MQKYARTFGAWIHRRKALAAAAAALSCLRAASSEAKSMTNTATVKSLILAWRDLDVDKVLSYVADDIVWHSHAGGKPPLVGKPAVRAFITALKAAITDNTWRVFAMAESDDTVYCEGVDDFKLKTGQRVIAPYMGMMKFRDGLVVEWRDYFDGALVEKMKKGEFDFAKDSAAKLWDRPALF
jgi:limonene-1,2-epoxide hydrolase